MKSAKCWMGLFAGVCLGVLNVSKASGAVMVGDVKAKQRFPWNGLVDISCTVTGIETAHLAQEFVLQAVDTDLGTMREVSHFWVVRNGRNSADTVVPTNGEYRLLWDAQADLGAVIASNMVARVTTRDRHNKTQLWAGGPYWADRNIGAEELWDYGLYFWWGDTVGYRRVGSSWVPSNGATVDSPFTEENTPTYDKEPAMLQREGWITAQGRLAPEHDAAHMQWGGAWRMPTYQELNDLCCNKCDWTWTRTNGVGGYIVSGRGVYSSRSIFIPAAGYATRTSLGEAGSKGDYWSSEPHSSSRINSRNLHFDSLYHEMYTYGYYRYYGLPIRPVQ